MGLIDALLAQRADRFVILTGARSESRYVEDVASRVHDDLKKRVVVAAGALSLEELVALLVRLHVFVTNDSGPMHLAAAHGVPMVSLWGPGRPDFYAPKSPVHRTIYQHYRCSPCLYMFTTFEGMWCNHEGWCMQEISVETVVLAVEETLAKRA